MVLVFPYFCPLSNIWFLGFLTDDSDKNEKEDMMKSENNSQWSEDDSPPILVLSKPNQNTTNKFEPLLKPLAYKHEPQSKA